jgi:serine/threonine protein kinase
MGVVVAAKGRGRTYAVKVYKAALFGAADLVLATNKLREEIKKMARASEGGLNEFVVVPAGIVTGQAPPTWLAALGPHAGACAINGNHLLGLVMSWEDGGTLHELLHDKRRAWGAGTAARLQLCAQLASGVALLHAAGVVHGDIKGENVLLSDKSAAPRPRFSDFGLAELRTVATAAASHCTAVGAKRGTWPYMAPEMLLEKADGSPPDECGVSRSADMYALGVLCWEVLSGSTPWGGYTEQQRITALLSGSPTTVGVPLTAPPLPVDTPAAVKELLGACLGAVRTARPRASEFAEGLHQASQTMQSGSFDIFLSHAWGADGKHAPLTTEVYLRLLDSGLRVWLDTAEMGADPDASMRAGIAKSGCVVALVSERYGASRNCLFELRCALDAGKPVVACLADPTPGWFPSGELQTMLDPKRNFFPDLRAAAAVDWSALGLAAGEREQLTKAPNALPKVLQLVKEVQGRAPPSPSQQQQQQSVGAGATLAVTVLRASIANAAAITIRAPGLLP